MSDLINRQDAIDAFEKQLDYLQMLNKDENPTAESKWYGVNWARNTIADLPSAEPERKKGKWIPQDFNKKTGYGTTTVYYYPKCSECGHSGDYEMNFCPHCGADMRGE